MTATQSLRERIAARRIPLALLALAGAAVLARLYRLGERVIYYDEAWFGYWTLKFMDTGAWEYRPILHGPFFARVNPLVFSVFGASDFSARLVVAVIGGLLPLTAWLFREHLDDVEMVALAGLLAANPILLYYSRFMRKDLPLAAFMLVALGLLVRLYDTGRARYLYGAAIAMGIAASTKESVLLWWLTWLGAGVLVLDHHLFAARVREGTAVATLRERARDWLAWTWRWLHHLLAGFLVFLGVIVYFYAPRGGGYVGGAAGDVGLWRALTGEFHTLPAVVEASTIGAIRLAVDYWVGGSAQNHPYIPYLQDTLQTLAEGAPAVVSLAVVGFLYDRYAREQSRALVSFNFFCGVAATLGYPLANNFPVPWSTVHAVVPLTVPAAVGGALLFRVILDRATLAAPSGVPDRVPWRAAQSVVAALVLSALVVSAAGTAVTANYQAPQESPRLDPGSELVFYAQSPDVVGDVDAAIRRAATDGENSPDVLYVGPKLSMDESSVEYPPGTPAWFERMPLPWYTEAAGANVSSVGSIADIPADPPPVVIAEPALRESVARQLGYEGTLVPLDDVEHRNVVVFVDFEE